MSPTTFPHAHRRPRTAKTLGRERAEAILAEVALVLHHVRTVKDAMDRPRTAGAGAGGVRRWQAREGNE